MKLQQPYPTPKAKSPWQRKLVTGLLAAGVVWLPLTAANAFITDTVVASGTIAGAPVTSTSTVNVSVVPAAPAMTVQKFATLHDGGDGSMDVGDSISYTFTVKNTRPTSFRLR